MITTKIHHQAENHYRLCHTPGHICFHPLWLGPQVGLCRLRFILYTQLLVFTHYG